MNICDRIGVQFYWPWNYTERLPWHVWVFSTSHDTGSWFWRILGIEINIPRD